MDTQTVDGYGNTYISNIRYNVNKNEVSVWLRPRQKTRGHTIKKKKKKKARVPTLSHF